MQNSSAFQYLALDTIHESRTNPRRTFDEGKLLELAESIKHHGLIQPVTVRPNSEGFELIAGARRYRAAQLAELFSIPARIVEIDDTQALEWQLVENAQRADIHPYEEAQGFQRLLDLPGYDVATLVEKSGKSASHIYARLSLLQLIPEVAEAFTQERITASHANLIARLPQESQAEAFEQCWRKDWQDSEPQHNLQSLTIEHLTNTLNAKMDLWVLENLNDTLTGYLDTGDDPHHAIDFEIDRDFRNEMKATWLEWYPLLTAGQDKLSRYLRLIVCAEEHQASANGLAGLLVGPLRMNQILRTTAAALAVATVWQKTSPKDVVPGNLLRSRQLQESSSGFACAADRIAGQAILNACATFEWATDFVLLPLQSASLIVEEFAQSAFDRTDSDSPTMTQVSVPSRIMLSADREFVNALKQGRSALEALLGKKESQLFSRLVRPIERRP